jgi:hypothetical protein
MTNPIVLVSIASASAIAAYMAVRKFNRPTTSINVAQSYGLPRDWEFDIVQAAKDYKERKQFNNIQIPILPTQLPDVSANNIHDWSINICKLKLAGQDITSEFIRGLSIMKALDPNYRGLKGRQPMYNENVFTTTARVLTQVPQNNSNSHLARAFAWLPPWIPRLGHECMAPLVVNTYTYTEQQYNIYRCDIKYFEDNRKYYENNASFNTLYVHVFTILGNAGENFVTVSADQYIRDYGQTDHAHNVMVYFHQLFLNFHKMRFNLQYSNDMFKMTVKNVNRKYMNVAECCRQIMNYICDRFENNDELEREKIKSIMDQSNAVLHHFPVKPLCEFAIQLCPT